MYALTIKQPWASAIVLGLKSVENRTWPTGYRGPLAIHAGLRVDPEGVEILATAGIDPGALFEGPGLPDRGPGLFGAQGPQGLPRRAIVGVVDLVDVVRYPTGDHGRGPRKRVSRPPDPHGLADDPLACGPWCWILRNSRILPRPIPCPGQQSLWEITDPAILREMQNAE